ncbi:MAG: CoA transferase, partial [Betaproteobacteria bacterium]|nr:CoA transferase [Betaproteobacteria bacterium]
GNGDSIYKRLMHAIGRDDLGQDPALAGNDGRAQRQAEIDDAIAAWTREHSAAQVLAMLERAQVPGGKIYTIADIAADPQYAARGMIERITTRDGDALHVPGVVPKLSATPGALRSTAPRLGEDTAAVLRDVGLTDAQIAALRAKGVIDGG